MFDGRSLPLAHASVEIVMLNSVLHHAASNAVAIFRDAVRVAQRYVVVLEDLAAPIERVAYYHANVTYRNFIHDKHGIFRTLDEWYSFFHATPRVAAVRHEMMCKHMPVKRPCKSFGVPHKYFYVVFVVAVDAIS